MNPDEFLALAQTLCRGTGQAEWRSSVSRAYYCAFHTACIFVESLQVTLPQGASAHQKVTYCLQQSKNRDLATAGSKLNAFREARNAADYQLDDKQFARKKCAETYLAIAQEIILAIKGAQADAEIRQNIRRYARDTLKLQVLGPDN
jgi:hypothetical protein